MSDTSSDVDETPLYGDSDNLRREIECWGKHFVAKKDIVLVPENGVGTGQPARTVEFRVIESEAGS